MKRILLPVSALALLAALLCGCTGNEGRVVTGEPMPTSNVTSSPAPSTATRAPAVPTVTPDGPGTGSEPDRGSGLTNGTGVDGSGTDADRTGAHGTNGNAAHGSGVG